MRQAIPFAVVVAAFSTVVGAQPVVRNADWIHRPTAQNLFAVWPREAYRRSLGGEALISCTVTVQGPLRDCAVLSETPPGMGFGQAALALTPQFLMRPATVDGKSVESNVRIPITFSGSGMAPPDQSRALTGTRLPRPIKQNNDLVIANLEWIDAPTYAQVVSAYPSKAREARAAGHVVLKCQLDRRGRPDPCDVISEEPRGDGFAKAARDLTADFRGPTADSDGSPITGATVQIPFVFAPEMLTGGQPVIGKPQWTHLPEALDLAASFPTLATAAHVTVGHVAMACEVGIGGRLTGCAVTGQSPEGLGFDKAALALAPNFQVSVWTDEGLPTVGGHVIVPLRYEAGSAPAKP